MSYLLVMKKLSLEDKIEILSIAPLVIKMPSDNKRAEAFKQAYTNLYNLVEQQICVSDLVKAINHMGLVGKTDLGCDGVLVTVKLHYTEKDIADLKRYHVDSDWKPNIGKDRIYLIQVDNCIYLGHAIPKSNTFEFTHIAKMDFKLK